MPSSLNKRVLFFTYHFPYPENPGSFRPWVEASILKNIGYDITVITSGVDYITGKSTIGNRLFKIEPKSGIKVIKVYSLPNYRKSKYTRFINYVIYAKMAFCAALFQKKSQKIFVGTTSYFITFTAYLYKVFMAREASFIVDERDLFLESAMAVGVFRKGIISFLISKWDSFYRKKADRIITVSESMKSKLIEKGVASSKIEVIPSIDIDLLKKGIDNYSYKIKLFDEKKDCLIMYTGSFGMANDIMTILKASEILEKSAPSLGFVLVGGGEKLDYYRNYTKNNKLENVKIFSEVSREEARQFLYLADICVHALRKDTLWGIALSSKIFDYLAFKKPVIFSGAGEIKEMIEKAGAGIGSKPEDPESLAEAILGLYNQKSELKKMGENGYRFIKEHFSEDSIYDSFRKIFN